MTPAISATARTSPFLPSPDSASASVSGLIRTRPAGHRLARRRGLVRDVDHARAAVGVDVGEARQAQRSISRGISSTMLQGWWRLSSWGAITLSQPSRTAPFEPGRQKTNTPVDQAGQRPRLQGREAHATGS